MGNAMSVRTLLIFAIALFTINAEAAPVNLLGRTIDPVIPTGYCEIGGHTADTEIVNLAKELIGTSNQILALFADCKELDDFRNGRRIMLDNYGQILAQTPEGQLYALKGVSRSEYIQKLSDQGFTPDDFKKAEARVKQYIPEYQSHESLGLLSIDTNGLYVGLLMTIADAEGRPRPILGVIGMTLVKELPFTINLYQAYRNEPDLSGLLARQQTATANFVRENISTTHSTEKITESNQKYKYSRRRSENGFVGVIARAIGKSIFLGFIILAAYSLKKLFSKIK